MLGAVGEREILAVICTHGHASHVAAAVEVADRDEAPVALHPRDLLQWRTAKAGGDPEIEMADGGIFEVADVSLEVIHAPGHSPGSVCLYSEELEAVFSGDCLLARGPAPHEDEFPDFPAQLSAIGEHLLTLPAADPGAARARRGDHGGGRAEAVRLLGDRGPGRWPPGRPGLTGMLHGEQLGLDGMPRRLYRAPRPG